MKRILCLTLTLILVLSLCACGGNTKGLQVGYSRQSILPDEPIGLAGFNNTDTRISTGYLDIIAATCIAFRQDDTTFLLYTEDLGGKLTTMTRRAQARITEATGVPAENIIFSGTHTHSAPELGSTTDPAYVEKYLSAVATAAQEAIADLSPATLYGANVQTEGMNFCRHYLQEDGSVTSSNNGTLDMKTLAGHAREADEEMVLVKMDRGEDKPAVMLMNFQAHPTLAADSGSSSTFITADYIAGIRDTFEKETGMHFAFFQGAGGDLVVNSMIQSLAHDYDYKEYGAKLAEYAINALPTMEKIEGEGIQTHRQSFTYESNICTDTERLNNAKQINALQQAGNLDAAKALAKETGFISVSEARGLVKTTSLEPTQTIELNAVRIGNFGIATVPVEAYAETGMFVKDNSPFEYTMFISIANGRHSYMPTKTGFDVRSYESFIAELGYGAAEAVADQLITMLGGLQ